MQDVHQPRQRSEISPTLFVKTQPSPWPRTTSVKVTKPSVSVTAQTHVDSEDPEGIRMEIDLTKEEEDVHKPQITLLSTRSEDEATIGQSLATSIPPNLVAAGPEREEAEDRNRVVVKESTASSFKMLSSLPATSKPGLHQPSTSFQVVSGDIGLGKKAFSGEAAQASSSSGLAAAKKDTVSLRDGGNDSDSDSNVSGIEYFVDKSPDREIVD